MSIEHVATVSSRDTISNQRKLPRCATTNGSCSFANASRGIIHHRRRFTDEFSYVVYSCYVLNVPKCFFYVLEVFGIKTLVET